MTITAPPPVETTTQSPLGEAVPVDAAPLQPVAAQPPPLAEFQIEPPRLLVVLDLPDPVLRLAVRRADRQRSSVPDQVRRPSVLAGLRQLFRDHFRRRFRDRGRLSRSLFAEADRGQGRHHRLAADPLFLRYPQSRSADAGAVEADLDADGGAVQGGGAEEGPEELPRPRIQLARHRRSGPRRGRAPDLRLSHLGAVRPQPDHHLLDHRRRRRRRAGLFRRLDRSRLPALHRGLERDSLALSAADPVLGAGAGLLRPARHPPAVLMGVAGRPGARGIPARAQFRIHPWRRARSASPMP